MRRMTALLLPILLLVPGCADDDDEVAAPTAPTSSRQPPTSDAGGSRLADVAVLVDEQRIGLERACQGADASVVAVTADGRRVILVREEGLAIRLVAQDDSVSESTEVDQSEIGVSGIYEATLDVEGQATPVRIEVRQDVQLETCQETDG